MKFFIATALFFLMVMGGVSGAWEPYPPPGPDPGTKRIQNRPSGQTPLEPNQKLRKRNTRPRSSPRKKYLFPTVVHPRDRSIMILIPSGKYRIGNSSTGKNPEEENPLPVRFARIHAFYIDRTEITVEQYKRFNTSYNEKPYTDGRECPACPAMAITWKSANRYCHWAGKRLPTEAEWEAAARGSSNQAWPWGEPSSPRRANLWGEADGFLFAAPVGSFPMGASPYGVLDMIGNVWEWVSVPHSEPFPPLKDQTKNRARRLVKGGGWTSDPRYITIEFRNLVDPELHNPTFGFRCVKSSRRSTRMRKNPAAH